MLCAQCNTENIESARFCSACGARLPNGSGKDPDDGRLKRTLRALAKPRHLPGRLGRRRSRRRRKNATAEQLAVRSCKVGLASGIIAVALTLVTVAAYLVFYTFGFKVFDAAIVFIIIFVILVLASRYLSLPFGIGAVVISIDGLRRLRHHPSVPGRGRAVTGLVLGTISILTILLIALLPNPFFKRLEPVSSFDGRYYEWQWQFGDWSDTVGPICALDAEHVWALCSGIDFEDSILFFDGEEWGYQYVEARDEDETAPFSLKDIHALDENHVWAVGTNNTILFFNGERWRKEELPDWAVQQTLISVTAADAEHVWAVSNSSIIFFDGSGWSVQSAEFPRLHSISALDSSHVWAVGYDSCVFFDGYSWTDHSAGAPAGFYKVFALDTEHTWFTGSREIYLFDGSRWTKQFEASGIITSLFFQDTNHGWAVGSTVSEEKEESWSSLYFFDGSAWNVDYESPKQDSYSLCPFRTMDSITASDADNVWVCGNGIYHGSRWHLPD